MISDPKKFHRKTYKCKFCKNTYHKEGNVYTDTLGVCSYECGTQLALKKLSQQKAKKLTEERKAWRERKSKLKQELTKGGKQSLDPLQKVINSIVKLLDDELPCLARPNEAHQYFDAGHIYSVGSFPSLRYNLWNIHKQSVKSNRDLGGESLLMLDGLVRRYGAHMKEYLENLRVEYRELKLTQPEKDEALKKARELHKRLLKGEKLDRDYCNNYIGIYNITN